jgi:hypothetical protein
VADVTSSKTVEPQELRRIEAQFKTLRTAYRCLGWSILLFLFLWFLPLAIGAPGASDMDPFWIKLPAYAAACFSFVAYLNYLAEVATTARVLGERVFVYVAGTIILHVCGPMISYYLLDRSVKRLSGEMESLPAER